MTAEPGPEPWERLKAIFREALETPEDGRRELLDVACAGRPALRAEVEELLTAHRRAGPLFESPLPAAEVCSALAEALSTSMPRQIGRYQIRRLIAAGGMGAVYEAEQERPRRTVAVKVLRRDVASPSALRRFEYEAELLARLQHPAIAQVFEAGIHDDGAVTVPYFALEYIDNARPITQYARTAGLSAQARLELFVTLCDAVHHGHQRGVIHRDLKPSNVLVDGRGRVKVIDFGIARAIESSMEATTMHTEVGQLMGTIQYMSPEQCEADPQAIDVRSDVYSLGVIFYELLGERVPYDVSSVAIHEATRVVRTETPRRLGLVDSRWRGDLETIAAKALDKDRERRYRSAAELADDVRRHLAGEAIAARPASVTYQLRVFARRNKALVGGVMGTLAALTVGVIGTVLGLIQLEAAREQAESSLFDMVTTHGLKATELGSAAQGLLWFASAMDIAPADAARQFANRTRLRTWMRHVAVPLHADVGKHMCRRLEFHPAGRHVLVLSGEDRASLWELNADQSVPLPGGERPVICAAWSPDGERLALGLPEGRLEVLTFPGGTQVHASSHEGGIHTIEFSRTGHFLAVGSDDVLLWDAARRQVLDVRLAHPAPVIAMSFNHRGDRLATASSDGAARVFTVPPAGGGAPLFPPVKNDTNYGGVVRAPVFLDGANAILTLGSPAAIHWRNADTGELVRTIDHHLAGGKFVGVVASPDGKRFVTCGTGGGQLWDAVSGRPIGPPLDPRSVLMSADFSPDGDRLVAGAIEDHSTLWSLPDGTVLTTIRHQDAVARVSFSPDGRSFATAQNRGMVRVWELQGGHPQDYELREGVSSRHVAVSRDGRHWFPIGFTKPSTVTETLVREVATGRPVGSRLAVAGRLCGGAFSPDGHHVVTLTPSHLECRDWRQGTVAFAPVALPSLPWWSTFSADGRRIAVLCAEGQTLGLDAATGAVAYQWEHGASLGDAAYLSTGIQFTPDSSRMVSFGAGRVNVRDAVTGALRFRLDDTTRGIDISRDSRLLVTVTSSRSFSAAVWSLETGQPVVPPLPHPDGVVAAAFSPGGELLLTACDDGFARLWNWRQGRLHCPPLEHGARVAAAAFSVDGRWAFTTTHARTLHVWDVHGGKEVSPARRLLGSSLQLAMTEDFVVVPAGIDEAGVNVFCVADLKDLAAGGLGVESLRALAEVIAAQRIEGSGVHNLSQDEWLRRFKAVREELREPAAADQRIRR